MLKVLGVRATRKVQFYCESMTHFDEMLEDWANNPIPSVFSDEANYYFGAAKLAAASLIKRLNHLEQRERDLWYEELKRRKVIK